MNDPAWLLLIYGQMSLLAVGGVATVLPEMQRQVVEVHGWMDARQFAALFALAQAAPGPNMLVATVVGWQVAGFPGALMATLGMVGASSVLTWFTARAWHRMRDRAWRRTAQAGLVPVTVGLVVAAAGLIAASTVHGVGTALVLAGTVAGVLATRLHPLLLLAGGAALGAFGIL